MPAICEADPAGEELPPEVPAELPPEEPEVPEVPPELLPVEPLATPVTEFRALAATITGRPTSTSLFMLLLLPSIKVPLSVKIKQKQEVYPDVPVDNLRETYG